MTDDTEKKDLVASVEFTQSFTPDDGRGSNFTFEEGKTYELPLRSADHWVKNGFAKWASDEDKAKAEGKSSDVGLRLQDADRQDVSQINRTPEGTGESAAERRAREEQEGGNGGNGGDGKGYADLKAPELKAMVADRGLTGVGSTKPEMIKALERDDEIKSALAEGRFDDLTVPELQGVAERQGIDLTGKTAKTDVVEAVKAGYKPEGGEKAAVGTAG